MSGDLKFALAAVAGLIVGVIFASVVRPVPPDVRAWEDRVAAHGRTIDEKDRENDYLLGVVARWEDSARTLEKVAGVAVATANSVANERRKEKTRADSLVVALQKQTSARDSIPVLVAALDARTAQAEAGEREIVSLREGMAAQIAATGRLMAALDTAQTVAQELAKRLAIADDLLRDRPQTDRCKVLWFDCPSRTTAFVVGAVLGVVGGVYVATR